MSIAQIILDQLGGNRFIAMTGAKQLVDLGNGLQFALPRGRKVRVVLALDDTYDLELFSLRTGVVKRLAYVERIYADGLAAAFTAQTGLDTRL